MSNSAMMVVVVRVVTFNYNEIEMNTMIKQMLRRRAPEHRKMKSEQREAKHKQRGKTHEIGQTPRGRMYGEESDAACCHRDV